MVAVLVFLWLGALSRTAFGLGLQGVRDEPARMRALGFDVTLHRTVAFGIAAFVAGIAGVLSVFYNGRITPGSINLAQTIDVLIVAVIGGLYRLEGAWIGALTYALIDNYSRRMGARGRQRPRPRTVQHADRRVVPGHRPGVARRHHRHLGARRGETPKAPSKRERRTCAGAHAGGSHDRLAHQKGRGSAST